MDHSAIKSEARKIAYSAGLPLATTPFLERMLSLEVCVLEMEHRVRELEQRKGFEPPGIERR